MKVMTTQDKREYTDGAMLRVITTYYPDTSEDVEFVNSLSKSIGSGIVTEQIVGDKK